MRGYLVIMLLLIISVGPQGTYAGDPDCTSTIEVVSCYDSTATFDKDQVVSWSIVEAIENGTRIHYNGSFLDTWKIELRFLDDFDYTYLNDQNRTESVEQPIHSLYNFSIIYPDNAKSFPVSNDINNIGFSGRWFNREVFWRMPEKPFLDLVNPFNVPSPPLGSNYKPIFNRASGLSFILPTLLINESKQENIFDWAIHEIANHSYFDGRGDVDFEFEHSIQNGLYFSTENAIDPFGITHIDYTFNITTGVLQQFKLTYMKEDDNGGFGHNGSLVIENKAFSTNGVSTNTLSTIISLTDSQLPSLLLVGISGVIVVIIVVNKRLNR